MQETTDSTEHAQPVHQNDTAAILLRRRATQSKEAEASTAEQAARAEAKPLAALEEARAIAVEEAAAERARREAEEIAAAALAAAIAEREAAQKEQEERAAMFALKMRMQAQQEKSQRLHTNGGTSVDLSVEEKPQELPAKNDGSIRLLPKMIGGRLQYVPAATPKVETQ